MKLRILIGLLALSIGSSALAAPLYHVIDLGTLGGPQSQANDINASGQVVGQADLADGHFHAFLYDGSTTIDLGTFGGTNSTARGINASGQIVANDTTTGPYLISGGTKSRPPGVSGIRPFFTDINDAGQIVGGTGGVLPQALLYSAGQSTVFGGTSNGSAAMAINSTTQVVGDYGVGGANANNGFFPQHAFVYSGGTLTDLGVLQSGPESFANGINDSGQVVGYSQINGVTSQHAFLYSGGSMQDLGAMGLLFSAANDINNSSQIVGFASDGSGIGIGFLYSAGTMLDLNNCLDASSTGWTVGDATAINDAGSIAALGSFSGGNFHAILLTPVPEPSTILLASLGLCCLALSQSCSMRCDSRRRT